MQQTNSIGNITFVSLYSPEQAKVVIASELFTVTTHRKFKMPGICCADGCDNSRQRKPRYTIDTIVNNCCVLSELNSPEQARVLITSKLFSPLGFGYNSLAHIGTLACSGTVSFDKIQDTCPVISYILFLSPNAISWCRSPILQLHIERHLYSWNLRFMGMDYVQDKCKCREKKVGADALQKHRGIANR